MLIPLPLPIDADSSATNLDNASFVTDSIIINNNVDDTTVVTAPTSSINETNEDNQHGTSNDGDFENVKILIIEWKQCLQDGGCANLELKKKHLRKIYLLDVVPHRLPYFIMI